MSSTPVVFVPLYTQEVGRATPSPRRHESPRNATVNNNNNDSSSAFATFEQAAQMIEDLKKQLKEETAKNSGLMTAVSKGPGALAERIKLQEERAKRAEDLAQLRTIQLTNVGEALRKEIEAHANFRDEARDVVQDSSDKMDLLELQIVRVIENANTKNHQLTQEVEHLMKTTSEMAEFILQQTSTIERMTLDISSLREHAKREKTNADIQQQLMEQTIQNLKKDINVLKADVRTEQDKTKKLGMEKDQKIMQLVEDIRREEEKFKTQELAAKLELERAKRQSGDESAENQKQNKLLRLKVEEQEAIIERLRLQVKGLQEELVMEQENLNASKRSLHEARELVEHHISRHSKNIDDVRNEHEVTKNLHEQQRRDWVTQREAIDLKLAESQQESESLRRTIQEKDLTIREMNSRFDRLMEEHSHEQMKMKREVEHHVGNAESDKKAIKMQHDQLLDSYKSSREEVRSLNAQLRETRLALISGGDEQEKAIKKLRIDLEENIKEHKTEKSALQKQVDAETDELAKLQQELDELTSTGDSTSETRRSEIQQAIERHEKAKAHLQDQVKMLDQQMQHQMRDLETLMSARDVKDAEVAAVSKKLEDAKQTKEDLDALSNEKKTLAQQRDDIETKLQTQQQDYERTVQELAAVKEALETESGGADGGDSRAKAVGDVRRSVLEEIKRRNEEKARLQSELADKVKEIESLQEQVKSISQVGLEHQKQLEDLTKKYEERLADHSKELEVKAEKEKLVQELEESKKRTQTELESKLAKQQEESSSELARLRLMFEDKLQLEKEVSSFSGGQMRKHRQLIDQLEEVVGKFQVTKNNSNSSTKQQQNQNNGGSRQQSEDPHHQQSDSLTTNPINEQDGQQEIKENNDENNNNNNNENKVSESSKENQTEQQQETEPSIVTAPTMTLPQTLRSHLKTFSERQTELVAKLEVFSSHYNEKCRLLRETEQHLALSKKRYDEFFTEVENSKELKDALSSAELRKQLEATKERLRSVIRYQMATGGGGSPGNNNNNNNEGSETRGRLTNGTPLRLVRARSTSTNHHQFVNGSQPSTENGSEFVHYRNGGIASSATSPPLSSNNNHYYYQQQQQQQPFELSAGSLLDVDTMKEMARSKWQAVSETYCPGAPSREEVWWSTHPEVLERRENDEAWKY